MAVRSLEQIMSELAQVDAPRENNIRQQQALIPQQLADDEKQLQAKQTQAFDDILGGARRRGLGFAGIPIAEQARYTSTEFLPSLARARTQSRQNALSLEDAILGLQKERFGQANVLRQQDIDNDYRNQMFDFEKQKYNEQVAEARRQASAARASASSPLGGLFKPQPQNIKPNSPGLAPVTPSREDQMLFNQMFINPKGGQWDDRALVSDYNATLKSARYGNTRDKQKLAMYHSVRPDLFGREVPISAISNGGKLSY